MMLMACSTEPAFRSLNLLCTLASSAVSGISGMVRLHAERAPLRRRTEIAEVGDTALFLASSLSRGVTGEVIHVDGGFHILGA